MKKVSLLPSLLKDGVNQTMTLHDREESEGGVKKKKKTLILPVGGKPI
jgi:hypothetical protein